MDARLVNWARAVKARRRGAAGLPALWLFTDTHRLPDPLPSIARLPKGAAGVVLRHDGTPDRAALGHAVARLCRQRRLSLVVAGAPRLAAALGAGTHRRDGRGCRPAGRRGLITASAHDIGDLVRAQRGGADLVFLSSAFPTDSHPGATALGPVRWSAIARHGRIPVLALGGINGATARRLPFRRCAGAGAIGALQAVA